MPALEIFFRPADIFASVLPPLLQDSTPSDQTASICIWLLVILFIAAGTALLFLFFFKMTSTIVKRDMEADHKERWEHMIARDYPELCFKGGRIPRRTEDMLTVDKLEHAPDDDYAGDFSILTLYGILDVGRSAGPAEIEAAYQEMLRKYGPRARRDTGAARFLISAEHARDVLCNPKQRADYDRFIDERQAEMKARKKR